MARPSSPAWSPSERYWVLLTFTSRAGELQSLFIFRWRLARMEFTKPYRSSNLLQFNDEEDDSLRRSGRSFVDPMAFGESSTMRTQKKTVWKKVRGVLPKPNGSYGAPAWEAYKTLVVPAELIVLYSKSCSKARLPSYAIEPQGSRIKPAQTIVP